MLLILATILIKEIVGILKQPPFNENLTLMTFDEKDEFNYTLIKEKNYSA